MQVVHALKKLFTRVVTVDMHAISIEKLTMMNLTIGEVMEAFLQVACLPEAALEEAEVVLVVVAPEEEVLEVAVLEVDLNYN